MFGSSSSKLLLARHRVSLCRHISPPHSKLPKDAKQAPNGCPALPESFSRTGKDHSSSIKQKNLNGEESPVDALVSPTGVVSGPASRRGLAEAGILGPTSYFVISALGPVETADATGGGAERPINSSSGAPKRSGCRYFPRSSGAFSTSV